MSQKFKIYYYKLTTDNGGAPCVKGGLLSLAICKPMIRSKAKEGDWIFGFAANSLDQNNRLIYIAQITEKIVNGKYYRQKLFQSREDCIYRWYRGEYIRRPGALHHEDYKHINHDLGNPPDYKYSSVLLSSKFRYFGKEGTAEYKSRYHKLKRAIERLRQGHRVNCKQDLKKNLMALQKDVWKKYVNKILGKPTSQPQQGVCHRSRSCCVIG